MPIHQVSASAEIPAPASHVYTIVADYHTGHPAILPRPPFISLDVEEGGIGAGTVIRVKMRVMGMTGTFRARVTEPEPGRLLVETDLANGRETSFLVEPLGQDRCRVTISTASRVLPAPLGTIQGALLKRMLHPIFVKELSCLAEYARETMSS